MNLTNIDFYAYRCRNTPWAIQEALRGIFTGSPGDIAIHPRKKGLHGYDRSYTVAMDDMPLGVVCEGGDNQRGWSYIGLTGQGCQWINDWDRAQEIAGESKDYELKRVDIAYDTFDTKKGFDATLKAYRAGGFTTRGRPPKCEPMKPERWEDSAIIRIGNRERDKYYRGYEKGKEILGPQIAAAARRDGEDFDLLQFMDHNSLILQGGEPVFASTFDWFRHEVELKPKTSPLPEDIIDRRDQYFAGAYPFLGTVLEGVDAQAFTVRRDISPKLNLKLSLEAARMQWGSVFYTALVAHKGDMGAVWDQIVGHKHSKALLEAGVLLVDHG